MASGGVAITDGIADMSLTNGGTVSGRLEFATGEARVVNTGTISSATGVGLDFGASCVSLVNRGEIAAAGDPLNIAGSRNDIVNDGVTLSDAGVSSSPAGSAPRSPTPAGSGPGSMPSGWMAISSASRTRARLWAPAPTAWSRATRTPRS